MLELRTHFRKTSFLPKRDPISWENFIILINHLNFYSNKYIHKVTLFRMQFSMNTDDTVQRFLCLSWFDLSHSSLSEFICRLITTLSFSKKVAIHYSNRCFPPCTLNVAWPKTIGNKALKVKPSALLLQG